MHEVCQFDHAGYLPSTRCQESDCHFKLFFSENYNVSPGQTGLNNA